MNLDLTPILPKDAIDSMDSLAISNGCYCSRLLWPKWVFTVDVKTTSVNVLQASAQYLASYGCPVSSMMFGMYCSRYYKRHGNILSDEVALHYLRLSFSDLRKPKSESLEWLLINKAHCYLPGQHNAFFNTACAVFLMHEFEIDPDNISTSVRFAHSFLPQGR